MKEEIVKLVIGVQQGDEAAFQRLYDLYHQDAFYVALKICNYCEADAQDVVQETFMEVHHSIKHLRNPEVFKKWMIRIVVSKCTRQFRYNHNIFTDLEMVSIHDQYIEGRSYFLPGVPLYDRTDKKIMLSLVQKLKCKQREVIVLQYFKHLTLQEIANELDIPIGTVKTRLLYGKSSLKELVEHKEKEEGRKIGFQSEVSE